MESLEIVAPAFVDMAHRIVWATAATVDTAGNPATRILHPVWEWNGSTLTGWIATSPNSLKARHLAVLPRLSLTYWHPSHDTCTARCRTMWETSDDERSRLEAIRRGTIAGRLRPRHRAGWDSPVSPNFGILPVEPTALRVMDGSRMVGGPGRLLTWTVGD